MWFTGSGAPAGGLAGSIVGDWYIDSVTGDYYEKTGSSSWTLRGNLKGPAGATGSPGTVYDTDQVGTIKAFSGSTVPTNWMLADGRSLLRGDYPDLFAAIGVVYGSVDGTHFNLPDLRSRFVYGATTPAGNGSVGGEAAHALTVAEMPSHDHGGFTGYEGMQVSGNMLFNNYNTYAGVGGIYASDRWTPINQRHTIAAQGGGAAHNNLPPYILIAQIIKVTGVQVNPGGALQGATGAAGLGVPAGGAARSALRKVSSANNDTAWFTEPDVVEKYTGDNTAAPTFTAATELNGGTIGDLRQAITPERNCWWELEAVTILQVLDANWYRADCEWRLATGTQTSDARGETKGATEIAARHSAQVWVALHIRALFKLEAGKVYGAHAIITPIAGTWQFWRGKDYTRTRSKVVGYW
jgi:microcystin-dependent protein